MTELLQLFWEFFKIGLFAVGGGPATLPYLMDLTNRFDWFTMEDLTSMIAVSESTPGPLGVNMSTYAGFETMGVLGGIVSTIGLVTPSVIVICIIAAFFTKFNQNRRVQAAFKGIRPAVTAVIAVAVVGICRVSLFRDVDGTLTPIWKTIIFAAVVFGLLQIKQLKKLHPFLWFVAGAVVGVVFLF